MSKILISAAPSAAQKKKWKMDALKMLGTVVLALIVRMFLSAMTEDWKKTAAGKEMGALLGWVPPFLLIVAAICAILVVVILITAVQKGKTKIEVTEDGVQGLACPVLAFSTKAFSLKFSDIDVVEAPKNEAIVIRAKGVLYVICAEKGQGVVELIKELKTR